ncbi:MULTISPECIES: fumarylacetoacetate hydrolase family protein [unclassified Sphingomonas]|uniref:fumarylacetoacetate hydrolase family protein n=1 Tax=unclassified Sphingomonas TaxID=196159 RepID=UPI0006F94A53|nr:MULTISPECIES: fumarylacetoacetate hydrolase family protein [unclassified Sphingomonas]KQX23258.1 hypothetical protein ASD17_02750 [Sphingomonas sp. Root1294]KQY68106.1 hypothetical protein ASD39_05270 [Sphingomonas sp. Root50]KRB90998.1 hypothetical protein ASE22_12070 [Sphingomonas sp. Root720]
MKLYTFLLDGQERLGVETSDGRLLDLEHAHDLLRQTHFAPFASMLALIEGGAVALDMTRDMLVGAPDEALHDLASATLAPPIPRPRKIRGFSVYERHLRQAVEGAARMLAAREPDPEAAYQAARQASNLEALVGPGWRATPGYYYSDCTAVTATGGEVRWPDYSDWIDYELELVAIIGRQGKDIAADQAQGHIFGYSIFNDLSARDAQFKAMATGLGVGKGKDFDQSNPFGPCIVTADEIPDPYALKVAVRVNGETWSSGTAEGPYWRFADCIAYASQSQTIYPGELFSTGCVVDCCSMELQRHVLRGDRIELEVGGIGVLRTRII